MTTDRPLRVIQWTTGNIGKRSLHAIIARDDMELVGVYAYGAEKVGVDAAELADGLGGGFHGAAGGEQVIDDDDLLPGLDGVQVDFQRVGAVLEVVGDFGGSCRQFARLTDWYETGVQAIGERRSEDETAGFDTEHQVDILVDVIGGKGIDHLREAGLVLQQSSDVVEQNAGLGEIRDSPHEGLEWFTVNGCRHEEILEDR